MPDHDAHWFEIYGRVALTGEPVRFENPAAAMNRWFDVYAFRVDGPESRKVAVLFTDVTERTAAAEYPLEIATGQGPAFLHHPLLRGGFLDDAYECFQDPTLAEKVMKAVSEDLPSFAPLIAQRCVLAGWKG